MGGEKGGMWNCLWCILVFGGGRGLASASFMMQDMGSCVCLHMNHKWVFDMLNTSTCFIVIRFQPLCTDDLFWSLFKFMALHDQLIYLPTCVRLHVCKCECLWTLRRKSDSQTTGEREQKGRGWWWWHNARPLFLFLAVEDGWMDGLVNKSWWRKRTTDLSTFTLTHSLPLFQHTFSIWELATIWQLIVDTPARQASLLMWLCVYA